MEWSEVKNAWLSLLDACDHFERISDEARELLKCIESIEIRTRSPINAHSFDLVSIRGVFLWKFLIQWEVFS